MRARKAKREQKNVPVWQENTIKINWMNIQVKTVAPCFKFSKPKLGLNFRNRPFFINELCHHIDETIPCSVIQTSLNIELILQ